MSLPAIAPYPMPTASELPDNRVVWTPDPARAALLVHDMQEYFLRAFDRERQPIPELIANITRLLDAARTAGIPVIYSAQPPRQQPEARGLLTDFWGPGLAEDEAAAIVDALAPQPGDTVLTKWRYSAFVRTDLHEVLREQGRDQLLITGIYAHIGCLMTAAQAFMEEVQAFFIADAVADFSRPDHDMALSWAARRCAVTTTTGAVLSRVADEPTAATAPNFDPAGLRAILQELASDPLDDFGDEDDLSDLGIDSIRLMGLVAEWQASGVFVAFEELAEEPTIAAWSALLTQRAGGRLAATQH